MPKKIESAEPDPDQINLKHRITGAAVLIFFGALVLPWLLGPPSEAMKDNTQSQDQEIVERHSTFEDEVLSQLQSANTSFEEPEETVYVSKITPVDGKQVASEPEKVVSKEVVTPRAQEASSVNKNTIETARNTDNLAPVDSQQKSTQATSSLVASAPVTTPKKKVDSKPAIKKVDVGWIVQVELLTDKKGAERLVKTLESKGFDAHTTTVDTNRGKGTGTRIWLGPFAQRGEAGAENDRLNEKMGKPGFIRIYP